MWRCYPPNPRLLHKESGWFLRKNWPPAQHVIVQVGDMNSIIRLGKSAGISQITVIRHVNMATEHGELIRRKSGKRVIYSLTPRKIGDNIHLMSALSELIPPRYDNDPEMEPFITKIFQTGLAMVLKTIYSTIRSFGSASNDIETKIIGETAAAILSSQLSELGRAMRIHHNQSASQRHLLDHLKKLVDDEDRCTDDLVVLLDFILDTHLEGLKHNYSDESARNKYPEMSDEEFEMWKRLASKLWPSPRYLLSL